MVRDHKIFLILLATLISYTPSVFGQYDNASNFSSLNSPLAANAFAVPLADDFDAPTADQLEAPIHASVTNTSTLSSVAQPIPLQSDAWNQVSRRVERSESYDVSSITPGPVPPMESHFPAAQPVAYESNVTVLSDIRLSVTYEDGTTILDEKPSGSLVPQDGQGINVLNPVLDMAPRTWQKPSEPSVEPISSQPHDDRFANRHLPATSTDDESTDPEEHSLPTAEAESSPDALAVAIFIPEETTDVDTSGIPRPVDAGVDFDADTDDNFVWSTTTPSVPSEPTMFEWAGPLPQSSVEQVAQTTSPAQSEPSTSNPATETIASQPTTAAIAASSGATPQNSATSGISWLTAIPILLITFGLAAWRSQKRKNGVVQPKERLPRSAVESKPTNLSALGSQRQESTTAKPKSPDPIVATSSARFNDDAVDAVISASGALVAAANSAAELTKQQSVWDACCIAEAGATVPSLPSGESCDDAYETKQRLDLATLVIASSQSRGPASEHRYQAPAAEEYGQPKSAPQAVQSHRVTESTNQKPRVKVKQRITSIRSNVESVSRKQQDAAGARRRFWETEKAMNTNSGKAAPPEMPIHHPDESAAENLTDDLTLLDGICPATCELLTKAGFSDFARLSQADVSELRAALDKGGAKFQFVDASSWPEQAIYALQKNWELLARWRANRYGWLDPVEPTEELGLLEAANELLARVAEFRESEVGDVESPMAELAS